MNSSGGYASRYLGASRRSTSDTPLRLLPLGEDQGRFGRAVHLRSALVLTDLLDSRIESLTETSGWTKLPILHLEAPAAARSRHRGSTARGSLFTYEQFILCLGPGQS